MRGTDSTFDPRRALCIASGLEADQARLVHLSHFYDVEEAFAEPLAVDGERYEL